MHSRQMVVGCITLCHIFALISVNFAQKSLSSISCGALATSRYGRIVGGEDAVRGSLPFIASLTRRGGHFCGATIVNDRWLLTAGHCLCNGLDNILRPNQINAVLGLHKISELRHPNAYDHNVRTAHEVTLKRIVVHPEYRCRQPDNDIALLELTQPITFGDTIQPICIAHATQNHNNSYASDTAIISGWGYTNENQEIGHRPDTLQRASVEIWSNDQCQDSFHKQKKPYNIKRTQMCAGKFGGGVDSCWADSGGPLVKYPDNILVGVVSTGIGCARPGLPGIYTRVSEYADWIENSIVN